MVETGHGITEVRGQKHRVLIRTACVQGLDEVGLLDTSCLVLTRRAGSIDASEWMPV